jgi:hypothetical protein
MKATEFECRHSRRLKPSRFHPPPDVRVRRELENRSTLAFLSGQSIQ